MPWLINAAQLDKFRKNQKNVIVLDATYFLPFENKDAKQQYAANHMLGARFLDLDHFSDHTTSLPHMLTRDEAQIREQVGALGITNDHKLIFYDNSPYHTSCRAIWMFQVFGHNPNQLYLLDGGLPAWEQYGGKLESGDPRVVGTKMYEVKYKPQLVRTLMQMKNNLHHPREQVIDMRHAVRYAGGKEPRAGMRFGHMPGSYCFPFMTMFEADGRLKPLEKIRKQLLGIGVSLTDPIVTTCGSGITAAILNYVLDLLGAPQHALYDGSWTEWGPDTLYTGEVSLDERPVITSLDDVRYF